MKKIKAWAVLDDEGKPLDILFNRPTEYSQFHIGSWGYPVDDHEVISVLITPITKKKGK